MRHRFGDQGPVNGGDFSKRCPLVIGINQHYNFSLGIDVENIVGKISSRKDKTME